MKKINKHHKIVWAVDPLQQTASQLRPVAAAVDSYAKSHAAMVELVYAYTLPQVSMRAPVLAKYEKPFLMDAERRLKKLAALVKKSPHTTHIATHHAYKQYVPATKLLADYASHTGASVIAVASHGRGGLRRLFVGSFAEDVLLTSTLPVLIVGAHVRHVTQKKPGRILLPVDFTPRCRQLLKRGIEYAKAQKAGLTLFHGVVDTLAPLIQPAAMALGGMYPFDADGYLVFLGSQRNELEKWVKIANRAGVKTDSEFFTGPATVYEGICACAKKGHYDLILMGAHHGAVSSLLVGSVTRQVVRHAEVPVLAVKI